MKKGDERVNSGQFIADIKRRESRYVAKAVMKYERFYIGERFFTVTAYVTKASGNNPPITGICLSINKKKLHIFTNQSRVTEIAEALQGASKFLFSIDSEMTSAFLKESNDYARHLDQNAAEQRRINARLERTENEVKSIPIAG